MSPYRTALDVIQVESPCADGAPRRVDGRAPRPAVRVTLGAPEITNDP